MEYDREQLHSDAIVRTKLNIKNINASHKNKQLKARHDAVVDSGEETVLQANIDYLERLNIDKEKCIDEIIEIKEKQRKEKDRIKAKILLGGGE